MTGVDELMLLEDVVKFFRDGRGFGAELAALLGRAKAAARAVRAVRGVNLAVRRGEVLGLAGESGSGKSTLGRIMAGLYTPDSGRALFEGRDLAAMNAAEGKAFRRRVQIMFQDPVSSLNPRLSAAATLAEGFVIHEIGDKKTRARRVEKLMEEVGLSPEYAGRYPHQFSGGQRQRLSLARALSLDPELLIADEPVSALDVSIQAQIVNLLLDLKEKRGLTLVMISHDLPLLRFCADRTAVMYGGLLMEISARENVDAPDMHPYTRSLWVSVEGGAGGTILKGEPPDPQNPPPGCPFHPRCPEAIEICAREMPPMKELRPGLTSACHRRQYRPGH